MIKNENRVINEDMLNVISAVQSYRNFLLDESMMIKKKNFDCDKVTEEYYYSIDKEILNRANLKANLNDFRKIKSFVLTDEMENTEYSELGKFEF